MAIGQHAQQIARRERGPPLLERLARALAHLGRRAAERDGELRAQHVGEAGEELTEVDARVGESRDEARTRRPRAARRAGRAAR